MSTEYLETLVHPHIKPLSDIPIHLPKQQLVVAVLVLLPHNKEDAILEDIPILFQNILDTRGQCLEVVLPFVLEDQEGLGAAQGEQGVLPGADLEH